MWLACAYEHEERLYILLTGDFWKHVTLWILVRPEERNREMTEFRTVSSASKVRSPVCSISRGEAEGNSNKQYFEVSASRRDLRNEAHCEAF